jgi:hypothetical protein
MRYRVTFLLSVAILPWAGLPSEAAGQERNGFWIAVSGGVGTVGGSVDGVELDRGGGVWFPTSLSLGWTLTSQLLVGVDLGGYGITFYETTGDVDSTGVDLAAAVTYYPRATSGFFVTAGVGPSFLTEQSDVADTNIHGKGFAMMGSVGYDFYLGRNFSLTSAVEVRYGRIGELTFNERIRRNVNHDVVTASIGIKFN